MANNYLLQHNISLNRFYLESENQPIQVLLEPLLTCLQLYITKFLLHNTFKMFSFSPFLVKFDYLIVTKMQSCQYTNDIADERKKT